MKSSNIKIFDTTLRDGTQAEGFSLGIQDKVAIAKELDTLSVHYIEGGWPGSNPRDSEFFEIMKSTPLKNSKLCAFGATYHKKFNGPEECPSLQKTIKSGAQVACVFGKTWDLHSKTLLGITEEKNKEIIQKTVRFLKQNNLEVIFDAEHFFDGYNSNPDFALAALQSAIDGGADNITLCDTNGGMLPSQIFNITKKVCESFPHTEIGIHVHNDGGLAVANTLTAIDAGARLVQGTINGIGERCGNANLCSILPNIELKTEYSSIGKENLKKLKHVSQFVATRGNYTLAKNLPFIGKSAFAHKGGIHVSAVRKDPASYESICPESVGNMRNITISDLSGKSNLLDYAQRKGFNIQQKDDIFWTKTLASLKNLEQQGIQFEGAEASFDLFFERHWYEDMKFGFEIENFFVHTSRKEFDTNALVEATIIGTVEEEKFHSI